MNYPNFKDVKTFKNAFIQNVENKYAIEFADSTSYQQYVVLGEMLRMYIAKDWHETIKKTKNLKARQVYYFSMEFLMGRMVTNNLMNAGVYPIVKKAFEELGIDLNEVEHQETDAGLGNGGLGRLAACFMDSVASLGLPVHGNCIRYRYGFFEQGIRNGYQVEHPDRWLKDVNVWEVRKDEESVEIPFYGYIDISSENGRLVVKHRNAEYVKAVPYDVPIIGDGNHIVNTLRLWSAEPASVYPDNAFEYHRNLREISSMLYPNDDTEEGKILRLKQQYFFVSAGIKSAIRRHKEIFKSCKNLDKKLCFHINDTHPALIVPELMRILVDEEQIPWDDAWNITKNCCAYTNHTILAEALEKWPVHLFKRLLPRIFTITEEINRRLLIEIASKYGEDAPQIYQMAIVKDNTVHMANMAIAGSFSVNGVAELHTEILKNIEMKVFNEYYPKKFNNKTNGITHRRWCLHINPELVNILNEYCGTEWVKNPDLFEKLLPYADDPQLQEKFIQMKRARKQALANMIYKSQGVSLDTNSIFDVQVKRLHEYKRQLMNALHVMAVYNRLKTDVEFRKNYHPHSFIFGAKSAPSYVFAKKVIKLINTIADKVNNDYETNRYLKVVFVVNYNVTYAETIMPAANVSEQISTASKEASGTGNMKFMMNGAITCGTLDGANVEIKDLVGEDNIVIFGMNAKEVTDLYQDGGYNPMEIYENNPVLHEVIDQLTNGFFENVAPDEFNDIRDNLLYRDPYLVLKDFDSYAKAQEEINELYKDTKKWVHMSIVNVAKSGFFTTDRTMRQYNEDIWKVEPIVTEVE
ncbi:MAG: glycogen/starch/alpha-glucan phosphorylase [Acholeplasmatales bacterium]|jgi:starch phosphorylase|nr:glycogen/starch/alpha-glucan phosphorylase [Acholeplasmatales bacterium]MCI9652940.1 glycogen/starch/alpha-glucan phosphorylase [Acholeplasmatales bacterium]